MDWQANTCLYVRNLLVGVASERREGLEEVGAGQELGVMHSQQETNATTNQLHFTSHLDTTIPTKVLES